MQTNIFVSKKLTSANLHVNTNSIPQNGLAVMNLNVGLQMKVERKNERLFALPNVKMEQKLVEKLSVI